MDFKGIYKVEPLKFEDGIPVFSETNEYIQNYERISADHLTEMQKTGGNPFIREGLWREMENSTAELVSKYSEGVRRILDVGVGLARLLSFFPLSFEKYGMDISMDYLKIAQSKGINVCYSLVEDMPYRENFFDMIICTDLLEHVLDLNLACAKILSALKPDGILIVRVPYRENLSPYLAQDYPYKFVHLRSFDESSLRLLFEKIFGCVVCEYRTLTVGYVGGWSLFKLPLPSHLRFLFEQLIRYTSYASKKVHEWLVGRLYYPVEINVVVRKTERFA